MVTYLPSSGSRLTRLSAPELVNLRPRFQRYNPSLHSLCRHTNSRHARIHHHHIASDTPSPAHLLFLQRMQHSSCSSSAAILRVLLHLRCSHRRGKTFNMLLRFPEVQNGPRMDRMAVGVALTPDRGRAGLMHWADAD